MSITLSRLPQDRIASAAGRSNFVRITAGAFGTSISTTLWENRAAMHHAHLTEAIHGGNLAAAQTLDNLQVSGRSVAQALASVDRMINAQADVLSANDVFYASAILLPLIWLTRRTRSAAADAGGAH